MRWIFISPHLDDAALCAGAWIHSLSAGGKAVEIWTLMAGAPSVEVISDFAAEMHAKWGTSTIRNTVDRRREEDREAGRILGAEVTHFDFLDAIYRLDSDGLPLYADPIGVNIPPEDAVLVNGMSGTLASCLRPDDQPVSLLGIGAHVDHILARRSLERLGRHLWYVADFPYIYERPDAVEGSTAGLTRSVQQVTLADREAWFGAVQAYKSQLPTLMDGWASLARAMDEVLLGEQGVPVWTASDGAEPPRGT